eukprot:92203-Rhodomonas_salina.2
MGAGSDAVQTSLNFTFPLIRVRGHALELRTKRGCGEGGDVGEEGGDEMGGEGGAGCCMQVPPPYLEARLPLEFQALIIPRQRGRVWVGTTYQELHRPDHSGHSTQGEGWMEGDDATFEVPYRPTRSLRRVRY